MAELKKVSFSAGSLIGLMEEVKMLKLMLQERDKKIINWRKEWTILNSTQEEKKQ